MARKTHNHRLDLPPLELECMKSLWAIGSGTVHEIRWHLQDRRPLAYSTVMTIMDRLARKGIVEREKRSRAHVYRPAVGEPLVRDRALSRLIDSFFRGSRDELRRYLEPSEKNGHEVADVNSTMPVPSETPRRSPARANIDPSLL